jgi:hypothetical protein
MVFHGLQFSHNEGDSELKIIIITRKVFETAEFAYRMHSSML